MDCLGLKSCPCDLKTAVSQCFLPVGDKCQERGNICKTYPWQVTFRKLSVLIQWVFVRTRLDLFQSWLSRTCINQFLYWIHVLGFSFLCATMPEGDWCIFFLHYFETVSSVHLTPHVLSAFDGKARRQEMHIWERYIVCGLWINATNGHILHDFASRWST